MQKTFAVTVKDPNGKITPCCKIISETSENEILPRCIEADLKFRPHRRLTENDRLAILGQHASLPLPWQTRIGVKDLCRNHTIAPRDFSSAEMESELSHLIEPFDQRSIRNGFDRRLGQMPHAELRMIIIHFHILPFGLF